MDVLMLLSAHEGLPNALIEAQLAGVPVVTTDAGGASEAILPGKTGVVLPVDSTPGEVATTVSDLVAQPDRLRIMGALAQEWAAQAFPVSRMLSNTLEVYAAAGMGRRPVTGRVAHEPLVNSASTAQHVSRASL
jgi:glycosyltransferase involved in cell wall biosynthesis